MNKIITKTVLILSLVSLMTDVASEMLYPVMPVYLKSIGFSVLLIGILEGLAEATAGFSKGYFGKMSDMMQKRAPFIRLGYGLSAFAKPMLATFAFPLWIFFARTLDRLGKGIRNGARDALLSDEATPENKGKVFGFHRGMDTLGAAIGPFAALLFLYFFPAQYRWLFVLAFLPGVAAIFMTFIIKDKPKIIDIKKAKSNQSFFSFVKYWNVASSDYKKLVTGLLGFTLFNSSDVFLLLIVNRSIFIQTHNQTTADLTMIGFYIFYNLVYALSSYPLGIVADKIGLKKIMVLGLLLFAFVYGSVSFVNSYILLAILFLIYGLYAAATDGISKALITNLSQKEHTATAVGFYSSFASFFSLIASSLGGWIWFTFGASAMFLFSAIGVLLVVFYLVYTFDKINLISKIRTKY